MARWSFPSPFWVATAVVALLLAVAAPALATSGDDQWPAVIDLPVGYQPEGIVVTRDGTAYAGSLATGAIIAADLRTGEVTEVYAGDSTPAVGIEYDRAAELLYVAGGGSGVVELVDPGNGELVDRVELLAPDAGFVNDIAIDGDTLYATESSGATLYSVDLGDGGVFGEVTPITLGGDFEPVEGFNANGIVTLPDGTPVIVQSGTGTLFRVDPANGESTALVLDGEATELPNGDGIEREDHTLYVVQNRLNRIAVVDLGSESTSGTVERFVTDPAFDVPTTVDRFEQRLYVVNARFGIENPEQAEFQIVGTSLCQT